MGNNQPARATDTEETNKGKQVKFQEINSTSSFFGKSLSSLNSQRSAYSVSRPWSRVSRKRWKESTLTLPYDSSKTAWPVSQLESYFLPVFPVNSKSQEDNYRILEEIAAGAFGKVYKVSSQESGRIYALKVLSKSKIIKENAVQQVKEEVQIQSACGHHTFIVGSPYHWQSRKKLYIVTDFVTGGELYKLLELYEILPVVLVKLYVAQLALAIDFLHNAGVIYRDLKPENILLDDRGDVQLVDFGLSKWLSYGDKTSTFCGTPRYMAPEVFSLRPYGHSCDWWSLGVIACRMLTAKDCFRGFKVYKDRVTIVISGNAEGFLLKPALIYKAKNPSALKNKYKNLLPVPWMHNHKGWITKQLLSDWFYRCFIPQVKLYLVEKGVQFNVLFLMDNPGGHARSDRVPSSKHHLVNPAHEPRRYSRFQGAPHAKHPVAPRGRHRS